MNILNFVLQQNAATNLGYKDRLGMDRHNTLHAGSRVELPAAIRFPEVISALDRRWTLFSQRALPFAGVVGFLSFGVALIATATLVALHIQ